MGQTQAKGGHGKDRHAPQIEMISAITLVTSDMVAAVAFYSALGMPVRYGGAHGSFTSLHAGSGYVNLASTAEAARAPDKKPFWGRVIFYVDDVDALHAKITDAGYPSQTWPADASWGERYFHILDPDGNELSFARLLEQSQDQSSDPV